MRLDMPLVRMMEKYINENLVRFHMPGHKGGRAFAHDRAVRFLERAGMYDLTEVPGTDNLNFPEESIKESQEKCAAAYGADHTFFLVNGSTVGIYAMIGAACKPGDSLLVAGDCHQSVFNALMFFDVKPVLIYPGLIKEFGIGAVISPEDVARALEENPECQGLIITRPTYYGLCCDIEAISRLVRHYGKVLLVDEAHGAHLAFGKGLYPPPALPLADACVQSAHKTLAALNQGAYLHIKGSRLSKERVGKILQMLQTSSPSYLIMASLDFSRALMESQGKSLLEELHRRVVKFYKGLKKATGFKVLENSTCLGVGHCPDRIVVNTACAGITGYDAESILRRDYGIQAEMADLYNVVLLTTVFDEDEDFDWLLEAFRKVWDKRELLAGKREGIVMSPADFTQDLGWLSGRSRRAHFSRDLLFRQVEPVPIDNAAGRVAGRLIVLYPPGIPLLLPGDLIEGAQIKFMKNILARGGKITGLMEKTGSIYIPCFIDEA